MKRLKSEYKSLSLVLMTRFSAPCLTSNDDKIMPQVCNLNCLLVRDTISDNSGLRCVLSSFVVVFAPFRSFGRPPIRICAEILSDIFLSQHSTGTGPDNCYLHSNHVEWRPCLLLICVYLAQNIFGWALIFSGSSISENAISEITVLRWYKNRNCFIACKSS